MSERKSSDTLCENIAYCANRIALSQKQYRLCVASLAQMLCDSESFSVNEAYKKFKELCPDADVCANSIFFKHISNITTVSNADKNFSKRKYECAAELLGMNEPTKPGTHGKISYVRNRYNDAAYENFSKKIRNAKFSYVSSFTQACEDVVGGVSEFAILPVENSSDGRLFGFYSLLDRYDLRICGITELDSEEHQDSSLRLALIGKTTIKRIDDDTICDFEFSLVRENEKKLTDLLNTAVEFSAVPRKIDTLPLEYDHELYKHYFTFRLPCAELYALALYLSYEYPNYNPIGFYPVENNKNKGR